MIKRSGPLLILSLMVAVLGVYIGFAPFRNSMIDWWGAPHISPLGVSVSPVGENAKMFGGVVLYAERGGTYRFTCDFNQTRNMKVNATHYAALNRLDVKMIVYSADEGINMEDYTGQPFLSLTQDKFAYTVLFGRSVVSLIRTTGRMSVNVDVTRYVTERDMVRFNPLSMGMSEQSGELPYGEYRLTLLALYVTNELEPDGSYRSIIIAYKTWGLHVVQNLDLYYVTEQGEVVDYTLPVIITAGSIGLFAAGTIIVIWYVTGGGKK